MNEIKHSISDRFDRMKEITCEICEKAELMEQKHKDTNGNICSNCTNRNQQRSEHRKWML